MEFLGLGGSMGKERLVAFDYLRVIAMMGILGCHFCYNFSDMSYLGNWFGCTFNVLFLMMSALLIGLVWDKKGRPKYGFDFLAHRFGRLSKTYYPFLVVMFVFCFAVGGYQIGIKDILMHLAYLPWFDKLPGFGHLWFITMIAVCYVAVWVLSRIRIRGGEESGDGWFI